MKRNSKTGLWVLTDVDMLMFCLYAREAIINYGERGYSQAQAEAESRKRFVSQTLKEARTLPVNFDK